MTILAHREKEMADFHAHHQANRQTLMQDKMQRDDRYADAMATKPAPRFLRKFASAQTKP